MLAGGFRWICGYLALVIHSWLIPGSGAKRFKWNTCMENPEFESSLFTELNRVLFQAAEEVESEQRLDLAYEVRETIRFEQSHISWRDRLRNTSGLVEFRLAHSHLPVACGLIRHLADPFIILEDPKTKFCINSEFVSAVTGLNELSQANLSLDTFNALDNAWFHDLADYRQPSSWYLAGDQVIEGSCLRTGFDALDIESRSKVFTIPKRAIVACKTVVSN
jgi:hypothetical protein